MTYKEKNSNVPSNIFPLRIPLMTNIKTELVMEPHYKGNKIRAIP